MIVATPLVGDADHRKILACRSVTISINLGIHGNVFLSVDDLTHTSFKLSKSRLLVLVGLYIGNLAVKRRKLAVKRSKTRAESVLVPVKLTNLLIELT